MGIKWGIMKKKLNSGFEWKDVTDTFSDGERHWNRRYLEICEVAYEHIECSLFSCKEDEWEIYVNYGIMYGVSYVLADKAQDQRDRMKKAIEKEFERSGMEPSEDFVNSFAKEFHLDVMNAFF